jgi:magnesium transporter
MVIRGMAIEEIELKDALVVFWKELRVAMLCGAALMAAKKLKMDPAVMASPVITTVLDASSLLVYFALAKLIMRV